MMSFSYIAVVCILMTSLKDAQAQTMPLGCTYNSGKISRLFLVLHLVSNDFFLAYLNYMYLFLFLYTVKRSMRSVTNVNEDYNFEYQSLIIIYFYSIQYNKTK